MAMRAQRTQPEQHKSKETHHTFIILLARVLRMKALTDQTVPDTLLPWTFILKYTSDENHVCDLHCKHLPPSYRGRLKWCGNVQGTPLTHLPLPVFHPVLPLCHTPTQEYHIAKTKKFHPFLSYSM